MPTPQGQYRHGPPPRPDPHGYRREFSALTAAVIGRLVTPLVAATHVWAAREWTT